MKLEMSRRWLVEESLLAEIATRETVNVTALVDDASPDAFPKD